MNRLSTIKRVTLLAGLLALVLWVPTVAKAQGSIHRLSAEFLNFDGTESETDLIIPGILVYSKTIFVPVGDNTLYVTISATGDDHRGNAALYSCNVDGVFCNPGGSFSGPPGWINLLKHYNYDPPVTYNGGMSGGDGGGGNGDMHDNSVNYQWCKSVEPGAHTVNIRLARDTSGGGIGANDFVFFESAHFYIDSSALDPAGCAPASPPAPEGGSQNSNNTK